MTDRVATDAEAFCCCWCGGKQARAWLTDCQDLYLGRGPSVSYVLCERCDSILQPPTPQTGDLYDDYPIHQEPSKLRKFIGNILNHPIYLPKRISKGKVLLDFGCGGGGFLDNCREDLAEGYGYEPSQQHAHRLSQRLGLKVFANEAEMISALQGRLDVMTLHMVLEHLEEPIRVFELASKLLKPKGILYFSIPNPRAFEAKLFGRYWHGLDAPRHISFPSKKAIESALTRNGLTLKKRQSVSFPNTISGSIASLGGRFSGPIFLAASPLAMLLSRLFPQGSQAFWCQKSTESD
jgi:SAM-dependent methyltransferase